MINKLPYEKKRLIENFLSLTILQALNYLLPFLTLPYLVQVLGTEKFGSVMFAQSFIQYFIILTDFGFNLSATRNISINRDNSQKVSEIISCVFILKIILLILSFLILCIIVFWVPRFKMDINIYLLTFGMVLGNVMLPIWFFQGIEKMKYITVLNVVAKLLFTILIFVFVNKQENYILVPLFNSLGYIVSGSISFYIMIKMLNVKFCIPNIEILLVSLKDSTQFFLSRISVSLYTSSNSFVLGYFTDNQTVGLYSIGEKLYIAIQNIYNPLNQILYPYVAKYRNIKLFKKIFYVAIIINFFISIITYIYAESIINIIFGSGLEGSVPVLRLFSIATILLIPSVLLGYPFIAALGQSKYANGSVIAGSIIHVFILILLILFDQLNLFHIVISVIITEWAVFFIRLYCIYKFKLWYEK